MEIYQKLYEKAREALQHAYAPYSGFHVGAALLTESGQVFTGVNVENATYGATICAERTAIVKAVSEGHRAFAALAVVSSQGEVSPCGICRQFLYEFGEDITVVTGEDQEHLHICPIKDLLPGGFRL